MPMSQRKCVRRTMSMIKDRAMAQASRDKTILCCNRRSQMTTSMWFFRSPAIQNSIISEGRTTQSMRKTTLSSGSRLKNWGPCYAVRQALVNRALFLRQSLLLTQKMTAKRTRNATLRSHLRGQQPPKTVHLMSALSIPLGCRAKLPRPIDTLEENRKRPLWAAVDFPPFHSTMPQHRTPILILWRQKARRLKQPLCDPTKPW